MTVTKTNKLHLAPLGRTEDPSVLLEPNWQGAEWQGAGRGGSGTGFEPSSAVGCLPGQGAGWRAPCEAQAPLDGQLKRQRGGW